MSCEVTREPADEEPARKPVQLDATKGEYTVVGSRETYATIDLGVVRITPE